MLAELYVLSGRDAGKGITAVPGVPSIFMGRAATNHIRVRDPSASRVHCRVDVSADGLLLHDNNSGNGTYVNGERIQGSRRLEDQDEISLGETRIVVLIESPAERARWQRAAPSDLEDSLSDGSDASQASSTASRDVVAVPEDDPRDDRADRDDEVDEDEDEAGGVMARGEPEPGEEPEPGDEAGDDEPAPDPAPAPAAAPAAPPARPRRALREVLPGYRIEARLGGRSRAGVAVYRARQVSLERPVALKVLLARGPNRERDVQRFVREARAIARLPHPNIVTIHDVLTRGTLRVIVMEYLGGGNLGDHLEGGALAPDEVLRVGEAVAAGLAYAHAHEVVHRNVKPSNVLFAQEVSTYKLADFGLAAAPGAPRAGDTSFLDLPLEALAFVAPELLRDPPAEDPRSDVYALGATLYACAAGRAPFQGRTAAEVAARVLRDDPAPLRALPAGLWTVIARALAKDPDDRYPDGAALLHELRACQAGRP
jgi:hypothetical protein